MSHIVTNESLLTYCCIVKQRGCPTCTPAGYCLIGTLLDVITVLNMSPPLLTLLTEVVKYGDSVTVKHCNLAACSSKVKLQLIRPCVWRTGRHLTLNHDHRITGETVRVNLSCPGLKQLFHINITWEVMKGVYPFPFKTFWLTFALIGASLFIFPFVLWSNKKCWL